MKREEASEKLKNTIRNSLDTMRHFRPPGQAARVRAGASAAARRQDRCEREMEQLAVQNYSAFIGSAEVMQGVKQDTAQRFSARARVFSSSLCFFSFFSFFFLSYLWGWFLSGSPKERLHFLGVPNCDCRFNSSLFRNHQYGSAHRPRLEDFLLVLRE